jgi:hypothetical protein
MSLPLSSPRRDKLSGAPRPANRPSWRVIQLDIDPNDHAAIAERCRAEWTKMEAWLANERRMPRVGAIATRHPKPYTKADLQCGRGLTAANS